MGERCRRLRGVFRLCSRREIVLFRASRPLLVALIQLFETLRLLRARLQGVFHLACHVALRGRDIRIDARGDGGEDGGAQRAALIGGDNLQRAVQDAQQACMMTWFLRAMPPSAITLFTGMPCPVKHSIMRERRRRWRQSIRRTMPGRRWPDLNR